MNNVTKDKVLLINQNNCTKQKCVCLKQKKIKKIHFVKGNLKERIFFRKIHNIKE